METLHPLRSLVVTVLAGLTAGGGFVIGHQQPPVGSSHVEIPQIDYRKTPPDSVSYLALKNAGKLHLSQAQIEGVKHVRQGLISDFEKYARQVWESKLDHARQEDEGTFVATEFRMLDWLPKDPKETAKREDKAVKARLSAAQWKTLSELRYDVLNVSDSEAKNIAYEPSTMEALKLSPRQRNQFETLLKYERERMGNYVIDTTPHPHGHGPRYTLAQEKFFTYYAVQRVLDPYQRLALEAIVRERLYVNP